MVSETGNGEQVRRRSRYRALCGMFMLSGILVELLVIFSFPSLSLLPLIGFLTLGLLVRCPACNVPIGRVPEGLDMPDASPRCWSCKRILPIRTLSP